MNTQDDDLVVDRVGWSKAAIAEMKSKEKFANDEKYKLAYPDLSDADRKELLGKIYDMVHKPKA